MMGCKSAISYDPDTNRYQCAVSGDDCMFLLPDSKVCAVLYGEGPDADLLGDGEAKP
ncbi:hypothetical protein [Sporomusa sp. KB1]|jgi:hypothetical protein|uniref:hypothetical protein n=1 Tax=Sporomusa sp. KB1 TaxID=943346 RepID=UPI0011ABBFDB|nr:hypothetical protein [Sporomusa sp. KB1]TWH48529.1 hypothetical protein Salpa_4693 [Sporomusa sp. KB1]